MTDNLIARVVQRLNDAAWCRACKVEPPPFPVDLLTDVVAALKAAQAEKVCDSCEQSVHELVSGDNGESWICINCVASIAKSRSNWWRRSDGR